LTTDLRDAEGFRPTDLNYDPLTVLVPKSAKSAKSAEAEFTRFQKTFSEIKRTNFDAIVMIHKGKFYEKFNFNAVLVQDVLKLHLTARGKEPIYGVPDKSFSEWMLKIVNSGKCVSKIKHVEIAVDQWNKKNGEKVIKHVHHLEFVLLTVQLCLSILVLSMRAILQTCRSGLSL
jgi:hypothetical protein